MTDEPAATSRRRPAIAAESVYEERFGFGAMPIVIATVTLAAVLGIFLLPKTSIIVYSACFLWIPVGAAYLIVTLLALANERVAVRVDERGIEMRHLSQVMERMALDEVDHRTRLAAWGTFDTIALQHSEYQTALALVKHVRGDQRIVSRVPLRGWSFDQERFLATVAHHAPDVEFSERR